MKRQDFYESPDKSKETTKDEEEEKYSTPKNKSTQKINFSPQKKAFRQIEEEVLSSVKRNFKNYTPYVSEFQIKDKPTLRF